MPARSVPTTPPRSCGRLRNARLVGKRAFLEISREKRVRTLSQNDRWRGLIEAHDVLLDKFAPRGAN